MNAPLKYSTIDILLMEYLITPRISPGRNITARLPLSHIMVLAKELGQEASCWLCVWVSWSDFVPMRVKHIIFVRSQAIDSNCVLLIGAVSECGSMSGVSEPVWKISDGVP